MDEQNNNKMLRFFETLNNIPLPGWVKKNILTALGKGIGNLIISFLDWPTAWFEAKSREIRARTAGNEEVQKAAVKEVKKLFQTRDDLSERALAYYAQNIIDTQINREDIAINFIKELPNRKIDASNENIIDEDWLTLFWTIAGTKTNEEVKLVLGKILASEVTKPKSISPMSLQLITNLSAESGNIFHKLCNLSIKYDNSVFVVHPEIRAFMNYGELTDYDISFNDQTELEGLGLIRSINVASVSIFPEEGNDYCDCDYAGKKAKFNFSEGVKIIDFTKVGREIRDLFDLTPNEKYTKYLLSKGEKKFKLI